MPPLHDAYGGGVGRLLPVRDIERHPVSFEGPTLPQLEPVLELLLVAHHVARRPDGDVVSFFRELRPGRHAVPRHVHVAARVAR